MNSGLCKNNFLLKVAQSMYYQTNYIRRNLSLYSSANNHLLAELCSLAIVGKILKQDRWLLYGKKELYKYINSQILSDGTGAEQSPSYLAHSMEFYLLTFIELDCFFSLIFLLLEFK